MESPGCRDALGAHDGASPLVAKLGVSVVWKEVVRSADVEHRRGCRPFKRPPPRLT
jgi:hypothetical protein